ncbi:chorismate synthase [Clostridium aminobutyricum]|uniref:Chorismate synthase n=1 Tax=Clostridium aminobutyricum TaxID=33953 RepID=A0A939II29_CLOAM|nr:chorismate synthase [Clostridium aminobutyricum]MBN7774492.1 chorismate synthase [Clostridium aminobutyricum]
MSNVNQHTHSVASTFGRNLSVTIFGGSHEPFIGVTLRGLPAGVAIDFNKMEAFLARRAPGNSIYATPRKEADKPIVQAGLDGGKTTGEPLTIIIENTNTRSQDYGKHRDIPRPAHADYTASVKFGKSVNMAGGGPFSARLTAPLCIAGAIALQLLEEHGIQIGAHISSIEKVHDTPFDPVNIAVSSLNALKNSDFPVLDEIQGEKMKEVIQSAMAEGDSVGGVVECCALGLPVGIGGPMYDGIEGFLSSIYFGIPAVKGVEFGAGFESTKLRGSVNNDAFYMDGNTVKTKTNHHGGILGGISSGMPIICRLAFKPTPSISKKQDSVSLSKRTDEQLEIVGRHDPCVVLRAVPVVEAATAIGLLDLFLNGTPKGR